MLEQLFSKRVSGRPRFVGEPLVRAFCFGRLRPAVTGVRNNSFLRHRAHHALDRGAGGAVGIGVSSSISQLSACLQCKWVTRVRIKKSEKTAGLPGILPGSVNVGLPGTSRAQTQSEDFGEAASRSPEPVAGGALWEAKLQPPIKLAPRYERKG